MKLDYRPGKHKQLIIVATVAVKEGNEFHNPWGSVDKVFTSFP